MSAYAQQLGTDPGVEISWIRIVLALLVCLAMLGGVYVVLRKRGFSVGSLRGMTAGLAGARRLHALETRRISPHADLCLVRCDDVEYLVVCTAAGAKLLDRRETKSELQT